jgi:hypothetical protein
VGQSKKMKKPQRGERKASGSLARLDWKSIFARLL